MNYFCHILDIANPVVPIAFVVHKFNRVMTLGFEIPSHHLCYCPKLTHYLHQHSTISTKAFVIHQGMLYVSAIL